MRRILLSGLAAAAVALITAGPVAAYEWCFDDPAVVVTLPSGALETVYVTMGGLGSENAASVAAFQVLSTVAVPAPGGTAVTQTYYAPPGPSGPYTDLIVVSSGAMATGRVYGTLRGSAGSIQSLTFKLAGIT